MLTFAGFVLKNLLRRPSRTLLCIVGIGIAIATVVSIVAFTDGIAKDVDRSLSSSGEDLLVFQAGVANPALSALPEDPSRKRLLGTLGVKEVAMNLVLYYQFRDDALFMVRGIRADEFTYRTMKVLLGRKFDPSHTNEVMMGRTAYRNIRPQLNSKISIGGEEFTFIGVFHGGAVVFDGGALVPLQTLQKMAHRQGYVSAIQVAMKPGYSLEQVRAAIEAPPAESKQRAPQLTVVTSSADYARADRSLRVLQAASWALSVLAVIIGAVSLANTMMMTVYTHIKEIGILTAIGWRRRHIVKMVLIEALLLSLAGTGLGILLGIAFVELVTLSPRVNQLMEPIFTAQMLLRAMLIGLVVGTLGGLYPGFWAAKQAPMVSLRHE